MTRTAVPLVALLVLGAGPFEMAAARRLGQPRGPPRRAPRRGLGGSAPAPAAPDLGRTPSGRCSCSRSRSPTSPGSCGWSSSTSSCSSRAASAPCSTPPTPPTSPRSSGSIGSSTATASWPRAHRSPRSAGRAWPARSSSRRARRSRSSSTPCRSPSRRSRCSSSGRPSRRARPGRRRRPIRREIVEGLQLVRRHPILLADRRALGRRPRRRVVLRRPVHDLPDRRAAPDAVPAGRRRLGRRRRLADRLALRRSGHPAVRARSDPHLDRSLGASSSGS